MKLLAKKTLLIISLFLCILILFGCANSNPQPPAPTEAPTEAPTAEPFALHSDVSFGMNQSEVTEKEKQNHFTLRTEYIGSLLYGMSKGERDVLDSFLSQKFPNQTNVPYVKGSIAGVDSSLVYYFFSDGKLYSAVYHIQDVNSSRILSIVDTLNSKYGKPIGSDGQFVIFSAKGKTAIDLYKAFDDLRIGDNKPFNCSILSSKQWIVQTDTGYVDIIMLDWKFSSTESVFISYSLISNDEYNAKIDKIYQNERELSSDL